MRARFAKRPPSIETHDFIASLSLSPVHLIVAHVGGLDTLRPCVLLQTYSKKHVQRAGSETDNF